MNAAQQGHRYKCLLTDRDVLALSSGERPSVANILPGQMWPLGTPFDCEAQWLEALPMRYHHGETPK